MMKAMRASVVAVVLAVMLGVPGCATNPATGRRQLILMSEQEEIALGKESDAQIRQQMGVYNDQALQEYVDRVGQRLARASHRPNLPWKFTVVDESAVNAFALPGGFIYLTRGILPFLRDEAELAAVLGHEVGHVDAKHSVDQYSKQQLTGGVLAVGSILWPEGRPILGASNLLSQFVFLKYGRDAELEADQLGVGYAVQGGWAPQAMQGLLGTLARLDEAQGTRRGIPNWALTHPPAADRAAKVDEVVAAAKGAGATTTNAQALERVLDGLVFGDSREKGMVRGNEFVHPILRFSLRFPEGWEIVNGDEQVSAQQADQGNMAMILELAKSEGSVEQTARANMTAAGLRETDGERGRINGLDSYIGIYEGVAGSTRVVVRAAHIRSGNQTYLVAGLATAAEFSRADRLFANSIQSFRALSAQEADRIQPNRVDFYVARSGDTWESIARTVGGGTIGPSTLAIMNGRQPSAQPRAGERLRVVVGG